MESVFTHASCSLLESTAALGLMLWSCFCTPVKRFFLWRAVGSTYWREKWLSAEKNFTNKACMVGYLHADEITLLQHLQGNFLTQRHKTYSTQWELFRLLAVMETVNNGPSFGRRLLFDGVDPLLAIKFGAEGTVHHYMGVFNRWAIVMSNLLQEDSTYDKDETCYKKYTSS